MQSAKQKCLVLIGIALQMCFLSGSIAHAQTSPADTAFLQSAVQHALATYGEAVGVHTHLYNGTEYVDYKKPHVKGDQFFMSKAVVRGSIFYGGSRYTDVPMLYDLVTDEVIVPHNSSGLMMKLITSKIDSFQLQGHTFVHHKADSAALTPLQPGFYDLMLDGQNTQFLVKRVREIQDRATQTGMEGEFHIKDKFYIRKDGAYHQVSSKRSVYKVFKDKKKQLQKYAASQRFKFRKQREEAILALASYYDSLSAAQGQAEGN